MVQRVWVTGEKDEVIKKSVYQCYSHRSQCPASLIHSDLFQRHAGTVPGLSPRGSAFYPSNAILNEPVIMHVAHNGLIKPESSRIRRRLMSFVSAATRRRCDLVDSFYPGPTAGK